MSSSKQIKQPYNDETLNIALDTIENKKQGFIFVNTKRSAEKVAEELSKKIKNVSLDELAEKVLQGLSRPTKQCERLSRCIKNGIAFHHAGLTSSQKELIENEFRKGNIQIIACTPTLCLSKDTMVWHEMIETEISTLRSSNPLFALSQNKIIPMKAQKVNQILNSSKLIHISSVAGYSIKVTPNHRMLVKRKGKRVILQARNLKKNDKVATMGVLKVNNVSNPLIKEFVKENKTDFLGYKIGPKLTYLIGAMLGDGYSGAETKENEIIYKGSPTLVGVDEEIFSFFIEICKEIRIGFRRSKTYHGTPQLVLGKNKWFREFLVRCGVGKRDKKHVSKKLMTLKLDYTASLLKGLFDTDGYVDKRFGPGFGNISSELVKQIQKMLLRFGIVSSIRKKKAGSMRIYGKEYKTAPFFELNIHQKKSIIDFYKFIGFNVKRKQNTLIGLVAKICSNVHYIACDKCGYQIYMDLFSGRSKQHNTWGKNKLKIIKLLGEKGELGSRELKKVLNCEPKKKELRLNHHYELIVKRRTGSQGETEWHWGLNKIGKWIHDNIIKEGKEIKEFLRIQKCPLCKNKLEFILKRGWRNSDFDGDIFWDNIREIKETRCEEKVYDVVLPNKPDNDHMFVANGFIVHNSMGLDLPAFRAIIRDLRRYGHHGLDWIPVLEYLQVCGRAGRPSFDKFGEAIAVASTDKEKEEITNRYINGVPENIYSKLAVEPVLRTYLLSLIATNVVNDKKSLLDFFEKTFWAHQYKDMDRLEVIITKILGLLEEWEFIIMQNSGDSFVSADEISDEKLRATKLGRRVSELYLDPLTANFMITCLRRATGKTLQAFSLLQMVCHTIEMRPLLRLRVKEFDDIQEKLVEHSSELIDLEPTIYDLEYDEFLNSVKTALFMQEWIDEKDEEYLMEQYAVRPGEIKVKLNLADWLLYATEEMCNLMQFRNFLKEIKKLRFRLKYGVKEELFPLLKFEQVGRVRARKLFNAGIKDVADVKRADIGTIGYLIGKAVAAKMKKACGQEVKEVKENKRKGQKSVRDYK